MQLDLENLRKHYASLNDDALLAIDRDDLVEGAQRCLDAELKQRGLRASGIVKLDDADDTAETEDEPDWLPDAVSAGSFTVYPGGDAAIQVDTARHALESAGVRCYALVREEQGPPRAKYYDLMVPGALSLKALSVLDRDVYNPQLEEEWRTHFAALSDEDFQELDLPSMTVGWQDRVDRLTRVYNDELAQRGG